MPACDWKREEWGQLLRFESAAVPGCNATMSRGRRQGDGVESKASTYRVRRIERAPPSKFRSHASVKKVQIINRPNVVSLLVGIDPSRDRLAVSSGEADDAPLEEYLRLEADAKPGHLFCLSVPFAERSRR